MWYIYAIQHNVTKRCYVGCTERPIKYRYKNHLSALKGHRHKSKLMQEDFDEYGADFSVIKLEEGVDEILWINERLYQLRGLKEKGWMKKLDSINNGYNHQDLTARRIISSNFVNLEEFVK